MRPRSRPMTVCKRICLDIGADTICQLLRTHGFRPLSAELHPRPTPLPTDLAGWLHTFARRSFLASLDDALADEIIAEVVEDMRVDCQDPEGRWQVMYVRLRVSAICETLS